MFYKLLCLLDLISHIKALNSAEEPLSLVYGMDKHPMIFQTTKTWYRYVTNFADNSEKEDSYTLGDSEVDHRNNASENKHFDPTSGSENGEPSYGL